MDIFTLENCQLDWNRTTGVLYVNNKDTGATVLRIQGLPPTRSNVELTFGKMIDIRTNEISASVPIH